MPIQFINGVEAVSCPCCKGSGVLYVFESIDMEREPAKHTCTHCMGARFIAVKDGTPVRYFGEVPL